LFIGATDRYGSVTPGKIADLVLLDADPLQDIHNTSKISEVFLNWKEFGRADLDQILKDAEAAAGVAPVSAEQELVASRSFHFCSSPNPSLTTLPSSIACGAPSLG
jgi:hypothetical protein